MDILIGFFHSVLLNLFNLISNWNVGECIRTLKGMHDIQWQFFFIFIFSIQFYSKHRRFLTTNTKSMGQRRAGSNVSISLHFGMLLNIGYTENRQTVRFYAVCCIVYLQWCASISHAKGGLHLRPPFACVCVLKAQSISHLHIHQLECFSLQHFSNGSGITFAVACLHLGRFLHNSYSVYKISMNLPPPSIFAMICCMRMILCEYALNATGHFTNQQICLYVVHCIHCMYNIRLAHCFHHWCLR